MKQVYRIDANGYYLEPIILEDNEIIPIDCVEVVPPNGLYKAKYINGEWFEGLSKNEIDQITGKTFDNIKDQKYKELDSACESTILGKFKVVLDEIEYEFSFDEKAQSRFNGTPYTFSSGIATVIEWTCYVDGQRTSIALDEAKFMIVAKAAFEHQNINIAKFRKKIKELNEAKTIPEVESIKW